MSNETESSSQDPHLALFRLFPSASLSVGHLGLNAVVMGGFEYFIFL